MQARSALFDLYGDYLRPRGGRAPVAALVRLLAPLGIAAPAVRTAVSRMVRQGWLHPLRLSSGPGYLLTPKATRRLDDSSARIYRTGRLAWDGKFDLLVIEAPTARAERQRLAATLGFLGYGSIDGGTWVAPRPSDEVEHLLDDAGIGFERFTAGHSGGLPGAAALVRRAWNLPELAAAYERFVRDARQLVEHPPADDEAAYLARFTLVHRWRTFLFRDPQLPPVLLPDRWPGTTAAGFFDHHATRLRPPADRFVDRCLDNAQRPPVPA
ncbi:PaaX family transcriptional regulator [Virgisporangium aurantiacum]|uniref:Phenylacetic acid degradation operon negative regulatory protein n=1 Tax=Virgisporangium aurantiacum TaxID=175570 RepID=A0A8J3YZP6_9ACTN|nr:PaaX family transcriptional regulator C-terminal domain-containing protein [Virgisporangium aurantiacum]GIJ53702.1 phenylacetic acid degradation operon negative regulatory protein [Virgisporangium aurantiacum]